MNAESDRLCNEIDVETTRLSTLVTACVAENTNGSAAVNERLTRIASAMKAIGADHSEPVPDNPPI